MTSKFSTICREKRARHTNDLQTLLSTCYVPAIVLGSGDVRMNNPEKVAIVMLAPYYAILWFILCFCYASREGSGKAELCLDYLSSAVCSPAQQAFIE